MSSPGDADDDPYRPHSNNYQSLKTEQSLEEVPVQKPVEVPREEKPVEAEEPYVSDLDKANAAVDMRLEEMRHFQDERPRTRGDVIDFERKVENMGYDELNARKTEREARAEQPKEITNLDRAKGAALKDMEERDIPPPPPDEPNRPETHGKGR